MSEEQQRKTSSHYGTYSVWKEVLLIAIINFISNEKCLPQTEYTRSCASLLVNE
jgi:hypothetical protein